MPKLRIGIPKGSLQNATLAVFAKAGLEMFGSDRTLWLASNDVELEPVLLRPQEIPLYVASGQLDCGIAGWDWLLERSCEQEVKILADLCFSKQSFRSVKWVLAVPMNSPWDSVADLKAAGRIRVSTELRNVTIEWMANRGIDAAVDFSWGATEAKPPIFADAIVDCTETGLSLKANGLKIIDTVCESTTRFFANRDVYRDTPWKKTKMDALALLLASVINGEQKVSLRLSTADEDKDILAALIPSPASLTMWKDSVGRSVFEVICTKGEVREVLPVLARNGAHLITVSAIDVLYTQPSHSPA